MAVSWAALLISLLAARSGFSAVAVDALADRVGGVARSQRDALLRLGVTAERPSLDLATTDPAGYLRGLSTATEAGELTSSPGLGDFVWVVSVVGDVPTTCLTN